MGQVRVCDCRDAFHAHMIRAALESHGIPATVVGDSLGLLAGSIPVHHTRPEIWVDPRDAERARHLVSAATSGDPVAGPADSLEWTCPNCAETVDGHFEICWKCQTPRPEASEPAPKSTAPAITNEPTVAHDRACVGCDYNVRGVPVSHPCPECGTGVLCTLFADRTLRNGAAADTETRHASDYLGPQLGYSPEAVYFVLHTYVQLMEKAQMNLAKADLRQVDVVLFCRMLLGPAAYRYGTPGRLREVLAEWGFAESRDIGRIVALTQPAAYDDVVHRFAGACTVEQMLDAAAM